MTIEEKTERLYQAGYCLTTGENGYLIYDFMTSDGYEIEGGCRDTLINEAYDHLIHD